ncbi:hypothetical protein MICRO116_680003 [Micrococcus sp. 116]|nr:hypothetical protein MICRO116_680003 [Micrococcus sp. 116]
MVMILTVPLGTAYTDHLTRPELRAGIITWIERTYHRRRRQVRLGRLTPVEYELIMDHTPADAA